MNIDKRLYLISSCLLLAALPGAASSITSFDFTPAAGSEFTLDLTEGFTSSEASVTGTIVCESLSPCTGEVGSFAIGVDLIGSTDVGAAISGILSGTAASFGDSVTITSPALYANTYSFSISPGPFDEVFFAATAPPLGAVDVDGSVNLSLQAGQSIDLPLTFYVGAPTAVPEPGTLFLLGGLLCGLPVIRKARMKFSQTRA